MDALDLVRRQDFGLIGGLLGDTTSSTQATATTSTTGLGGIIGGFTSIINGIPTIIPTSSGTSTTPTSTHSSSSSTGSTGVPSSVTSTTLTPSISTTASTTSTGPPSMTPTSASTPVVTPTHTASPIIYTSSDGTSIVYVTSFAGSSSSPTSAPPTSFLQNKPLEAGVFSLVGVVALIIIFVIVTFTLRRRRRDRLENDIADAVTFDPSLTARYADEENRMNAVEKYSLNGGSSAHGHSVGYMPQLEYAPPQPPQYGYYGQGYEPQAAHRASLPQVPVHNQDNPVTTGGANLTRKYSDRKPVPPLLPNPVYDPSRSPVLPSHFYSQENPPPPIHQSLGSPARAHDEATPALPEDFEDDPYTGVEVADH